MLFNFDTCLTKSCSETFFGTTFIAVCTRRRATHLDPAPAPRGRAARRRVRRRHVNAPSHGPPLVWAAVAARLHKVAGWQGADFKPWCWRENARRLRGSSSCSPLPLPSTDTNTCSLHQARLRPPPSPSRAAASTRKSRPCGRRYRRHSHAPPGWASRT